MRHTPIEPTEENQRAADEQDTLLAIARDINATLNLNDILDRAQRRAAALLRCDRILTYYWDDTRSVYRVIACFGVPAELVADGVAHEFPPGHPVVDRLLAGETLVVSLAGDKVVINGVDSQNVVPVGLLAQFGIAAQVFVPLVVHGRRMGALSAIHTESGRRFDARQVRLLEAVAQHVGIAIGVARLYRAQQDEAAVAGALARVGQELISSLAAPTLLNRLCQLTTEVLACDYSHTWLWRMPEQAFVAVAGHGDSPDQWDAIRLVKLDRSVLSRQLEAFDREGIFHVKIADLPESPEGRWVRRYGLTAGLMVPLRRGAELVGFHTAGYCRRSQAFDAGKERIARGIAQLASLALGNAQLVEELERVNRLKSDFVATMSHELRTPLSVIIGYTDLLRDGSLGALHPEQAEALQRVYINAHALHDVINATLNLSRLDTGELSLDAREVDIADVLQEVDAETRDLQERAGLRCVWTVSPDLPIAVTDPVKLKVVVKNLFANAVKFTPAGSVTVSAHRRDDGIEICVADTGIGISADALPIIFEPFRQVGDPALRQHGGVGLGLYIVRRLMDMLGGTVGVDSEPGRGSTFRVWIPRNVRQDLG